MNLICFPAPAYGRATKICDFGSIWALETSQAAKHLANFTPGGNQGVPLLRWFSRRFPWYLIVKPAKGAQKRKQLPWFENSTFAIFRVEENKGFFRFHDLQGTSLRLARAFGCFCVP